MQCPLNCIPHPHIIACYYSAARWPKVGRCLLVSRFRTLKLPPKGSRSKRLHPVVARGRSCSPVECLGFCIVFQRLQGAADQSFVLIV